MWWKAGVRSWPEHITALHVLHGIWQVPTKRLIPVNSKSRSIRIQIKVIIKSRHQTTVLTKKTVTEKNWTRDDYMRCFKSGLRRIKLTYFPSREEAFNAFTEAFNRYKKASEKGLFEPNYMSNVLRRFKTIARDYGFYNEIEKWEKNISQENSNFDG